MSAYQQHIVKIDLTNQQYEIIELPIEIYQQYLGGKALAAKLIYDHVDDSVEPFSAANVIVITTSGLTNSSVPSTSRFNISTFSPLTKLLVSSNCGGNFGMQLKRAGLDGIIITGRSSAPCYLEIVDRVVTFNPADQLWGKTVSATQEALPPGNYGRLVIGPAGEHKVLYAGVFSEERAAGRGGIGAIFGDKLLKGIIAKGTFDTTVANREALIKLNKQWIKVMKNHPLTGDRLPKYGTMGLVKPMQAGKLLTTKNHKHGTFASFNAISGETMRDKYLVKNKGCVTCPIQCARVVEIDGKLVKGPELETTVLLGSNLMNDNLPLIIQMNYLCDEYGLDTMTLGNVLSFAMELNEQGLWDNGLQFGQLDNLEALVRQIAFREGIGDDLAQGTRLLVAKYGGKGYAMQVKGLEFAAYAPRVAKGMALGYATGNRGACHINGGYMVIMEGLGLKIDGLTNKGKAAFTVFFQDFIEAVSVGGSCIFTTYTLMPPPLINNPDHTIVKLINRMIPSFGGMVVFAYRHKGLMAFQPGRMMYYPKAISLATGFKMTIKDFLIIGERSFNLERLINQRQGLSGLDDNLPARFTEELQEYDQPNSKVDLPPLLKQYYQLRGWDHQGMITPQQLKKLNI